MIHTGWQPDKGNSVKLHSQIIEFIKEKISSGEWPIDYKIPSQRALAEMFNVNRSTIVAAIDNLISEGLLKGNVGGGTRVIRNTWTFNHTEHEPSWNKYIDSGIHQPNHQIMQQINYSEFDPSIIRMGSCEPSPELLPSTEIQRILSGLPLSKIPLGYEEPQGYKPLRSTLCEYLKTIGINAGPENILITSGAIQALQLIAMSLVGRQSVIYLEKPSYIYSLRIFQSFGMQLSGVTLDQHGLDITQLKDRLATKKGDLLIAMPTFQNPTGNVMTLNRREALIHLCRSERLPIVEDDVYNELWLDEPPPPPLKAIDSNDTVLYIGGMSKNLGPGLRIGWVVGPEKVIKRLADTKMQTDYGSSSISQSIAAELLASGTYAEHNNKLRTKVKERRNTALAALNAYFKDIATWNCPSGGYFIWVKLNKSVSMQALFLKALKSKVLVHPGDLYEFHSNQTIRISYSYASLEDINLGIKRLSQVIECLIN